MADPLMERTEFTYEGVDGQTVAAYSWASTGSPKAVVQITHGAAEHAARYGRVADRLVAAGYAVYAQDHRAHGRTATEYGRFGVARPGGWDAIIDDTHRLTEHIMAERPGVPIVLFGHSMGSMIAQAYLQRWGGDLTALVLSGTTGGRARNDAALERIRSLSEGDGADEPSEVFAGMFAAFNQPFADAESTGFEWLSRDTAEVKKYVDDPWCGFPLSNGYVADMLAGTAAMWEPEAESAIRRDLPILVMGGDNDPVGGENVQMVHDLVERYEALGAGPITVQLYPSGRHEMLNEVNRDEVEVNLVAWIGSVVG